MTDIEQHARYATHDIDEIAMVVYAAMKWATAVPTPEGGSAPDWVPGGNSIAQDHARDAASKIIIANANVIRAELDRIISEAVAAERERCAKIAEECFVGDTFSPTARIAKAIRGVSE